MGKREVWTFLQEEEVVRFCRDLVRIKTVNPPGDELLAAQYVSSELDRAGLEVEMVHHSPTRASVLARLKSHRKKPGLLLSGHLDTVPVGSGKWAHDPFEADIAEGRIWGRGSTDMKGGLAALMAAAKVLSEAKISLQGDLLIAATAGEETDSLGATSIASRSDLGPLQAVVIPEPSDNDLYIAEKGALWLECRTQGKAAHGSMPELGQNAIMMMVTLINELENLVIPSKAHPLLGEFTLSVNTIAGGLKTNVVPDQCVLTVDMRTVPGQDHRAILRQIEDLIAELGRRLPDFKASVSVINDRTPIETSPEETVVKSFADVVTEVKGQRPVPKGVGYYSDAAAFVPVLNIPMILCGPGDARLAHQPDEHVKVSKLIEAAKIYTLAALRLLTAE